MPLGGAMILGGGALLGGALGGIFGADAAKKQSQAALKATKEQIAAAERARAIAQQAATNANEWMQNDFQAARGAITGYGDQARKDMMEGYSGMEAGMSPLINMLGYQQGAATSINPYDLASQIQNPYANFQEDPGYKFRQQQGEEAINRAAAAKGGRFGGAALKDLVGFNQNLASQEYQNFANRGIAAQQLRNQMLMNQAGRADTAALAAQQNQMGLTQMGGQSLANLMGARNTLGTQLGNNAMQQGNAMSNLYTQQGIAESANTMAGAGAATNAIMGSLPAYANQVPYAGGQSAAYGNAFGGTLNNLMGLYALSQFGGGGGGGGSGYSSSQLSSFGTNPGAGYGPASNYM